MGIKGLYSCLKPYSHPVDFTQVEPSRLALDAYPLLYKYKYDMNACFELLNKLKLIFF